ncbi:LacI family DNA-binding transcriptional regulator [Altererythrobacter salegens]|uniref:LacI family DNA-binding transcriptional regulator n=1 Tax=Croceibacterium salegens TaxID=1737568 RepID=A0A6I4SQM8_9SPHN|nr:LacI family DNA-binding transcriptional regulator [Croceibacterium salegens]MXO58163.1 LacI family DNA-binding transcriptional regulator [Croceibacterium salegens]
MATQKRRPTIIDIAKKAKVSFKTVSRVLNDNTSVTAELRDRVLEAMAELDYHPNFAARALAGKRSYTIAMLLDQSEYLSDESSSTYFAPYLVDLQSGAQQACRELGYHFLVEPYDPHSGNHPDDLRAQFSKFSLDGVLLAPPSSDRPVLLQALEDMGLPYVRLMPGIEVDRSPSVAIDEIDGVAQVAEHLLALGHRRIGVVCGPESHIAARIRSLAFQYAIGGRAEVFLHPGDFFFSGGLAAGEALLGRPDRPSAIFAANDFMAAGVIVAATRLGLRVPDDISVVGFDDSVVARFIWPPLTTVRQPIRAMARWAIEYLVALASGRETPERKLELPLSLMVRESTAPPAQVDQEGLLP